MITQIVYNLLLSFVSSISFGVLCNVPKKSLVTGGIVGMIGWLGYWSLQKEGSGIFVSSFVCSLLLAVVGQIAARIHKMPLTVFYIPGLAPVVPGITSYEAFRALFTHHYPAATDGFMNVAFSAVGLTCGLAVSDMLFRILFARRQQRRDSRDPR
jgi:uncharacterized membrane protein YjjB (DUF3815 family)